MPSDSPVKADATAESAAQVSAASLNRADQAGDGASNTPIVDADVPEPTEAPSHPAEDLIPAKFVPKPRTKKSTSKKRSAAVKAAAKTSAAVAQQAKFPRHTVERALRIPKAIFDQNAGKPTSVADAAKYTTGGSANGPFTVEASSSKKFGFLTTEAGGKLLPTDRARRILFPQSETDRRTGLREAVLAAPDLADVYSHYRGENLPDKEFFTNALRDNFKVPGGQDQRVP